MSKSVPKGFPKIKVCQNGVYVCVYMCIVVYIIVFLYIHNIMMCMYIYIYNDPYIYIYIVDIVQDPYVPDD